MPSFGQTSDALILGGGLAGLAVARSLQEAGLDWHLLEARPSFGGRIRSGSVPGIDLGPAWYWPHQHRIQTLLSDLGLGTFEQQTRGDVLFQVDARSQPMQQPYPDDGMVSLRVVGGVGTLITTMTETLDASRLQANRAVVSASRHGGRWHLRSRSTEMSEDQEHRTRHLVLALPPRLIARDLEPGRWASAQFVRDLSEQQTWMAGQAKFVATFEAPFWRSKGRSGQARSAVGPMVEIHDASQPEPDGPFALFGFVGLPAEQRRSVGRERLETACRHQLADLFGPQAQRPTNSWLMDWASERYTSTDQDAAEPSRHAAFPMSRHAAELRRLELSLAGTEFARGEPGYLEGALEAAEAAVREILSPDASTGPRG